MQKAWAKEQDFVKQEGGRDGVIGVEKTDNRGEAMEETSSQTQWGRSRKEEATFNHLGNYERQRIFLCP